MHKQKSSIPAISIVGIGGIFPQAANLDEFWKIIETAHCTSSYPPAGRWRLPLEDVYHPAEGKIDCVYSKRGCFVEHFNIDLPFDTLSIDKNIVKRLDPLFQLLLQAGYQAYSDGKLSSINPERMGVIVGNLALPSDTASQLAEEYLGRTFNEQVTDSDIPCDKTDPLNRFMTGLPAAVLAKALGLGGCCCTLDAACASSLYAIKLAVDELQAGRADAMLTGGVARPDSQYTQMGFSQLHALSPTGICAPFDQSGNGLVVGEGAGVLLLKRTADAVRDGDHIYAQIAGIGLSNDIGGSLLAPMSEGQLRAMHSAYKQAGWQPHDVDHIECHATGTPVGDAVEFNSLKQLWSKNNADHRCVLGAVKSNIGHLLTAAGSAAVLKTLLALKNRTLPPTAGFKQSNPQLEMEDSPFSVLNQPQEWPALPHRPRRAAVSAFGFGGINAHLLLEEWQGQSLQEDNTRASSQASSQKTVAETSEQEAIAIIGMDIRLGPWSSLTQFRQQVLSDAPLPAFNTPHNWNDANESRWFQQELGTTPFCGHYLKQVEITPGKFRIPPTELNEMLPRQALMLQSAASALEDAELLKADHTHSGVFIGNGLDLNATSFSLRWDLSTKVRQWAKDQHLDLDDQQLEHWQQQLQDAASTPLTANRTMGALGSVVASRIAREFKVGGPSFTIASEENSGMQALHTAVAALRRGEIQQALVGGVDMPGDLRAQLSLHKLGRHDPIAEGACAVVLKPLAAAEADGDTIYALIDATASNCHSSANLLNTEASALQRGVDQLCRRKKITANTIGYIDIAAPASSIPEQKKILGDLCATGCHITSSSTNLGHSGEASGLVAIIQAALALHHCILPATGSINGNGQNSQYWLHNRQQGVRRALISTSGTGGICNQTLLSQWQSTQTPLPDRYPANNDPTSLFCLHGDNTEQLQQQLQQLQNFVGQHGSLTLLQLATRWYTNHDPALATTHAMTMTLVCTDHDVLHQQITFGMTHLQQHPDQRLDGRGGVTLPACARDKVFYAPNPLGKTNNTKAEVSFVFPGSGNHFPAMGQQLARQWPAIFEQQHRHNKRLKDQYQPHMFWSGLPLAQIEDDHNAMIIAHVALCTALSDTVRSFGIQPQAAIGYSLGESSSLFSLKAWSDRDGMLERIEESSLFTTDLAGPCDSARELWKLDDNQPVNWCLGIVPIAAKQVRQALQGREHVYLLIVNTPHECIIGGNRAAVNEVVENLCCAFIELHGVTTVHCPVTTVVAEAYRNLHHFPTTPPQGIRFYSCANGETYTPNTDSCAAAILAQATDTIDFTRVINTAYANGVRVFIETGSGNSCSRMIQHILGDRPHVARPTCQKDQTPNTTLARLLGQLIAEGIPCDPGLLYVEQQAAPGTGKQPAPICLHNGQAKFVLPAAPKPSLNSFEVSAPQAVKPSAAVAAAQPTVQSVAPTDPLLQTMYNTQQQHSAAHGQFVHLSTQIRELMERNLKLQKELMTHLPANAQLSATSTPPMAATITSNAIATPTTTEAVAFDRGQCMEFAIGSIANVLGSQFSAIDQHPTRVRLPDEPLMLVDRIMSVEGEPCSMSHGRVITEHDVTTERWYLDGGRIPTCVAVEAGQADLFLSGYLGIDFHTKGHAVYRLLDAVVQFHSALPQPGDTIRYDIRIEEFFRQGDTWLFRFEYDCTVNGQPLMTMRNGCAGFFNQGELDAGKGVIHTKFDLMPQPGKRPTDWQDLVPMVQESYTAGQIKALRQGNLLDCFGSAFAGLHIQKPYTLPSGHMELVDRVTAILPGGGRFGMGQIRAEMDINPEDWFLTCHFCDDNVMPGTLMYECCLHTLRIYLMRMGWISEENEAAWEPVPGINSQLKCRGQVTEKTRTVTYEVTIKELGYRPEPFAIVDALMYADGKPIVEIINMSVHISGLNRKKLYERWQGGNNSATEPENTTLVQGTAKPALYDYASILAYSSGKPSEAFGEPYRVFDNDRRIARLPRPPFQFLDRITAIEAEAWKMVAGGTIEAQYDVPIDAWYFAAERQRQMPFSILLEIALQPCGWMAAYVGSALTSDIDLCFRNLDGNAVQLRPVTHDSGTLTTTVTLTRVSSSGGMIIQSYDFCVCDAQGSVYRGDTVFGFFTAQALSNQVGIRDAQAYQPAAAETQRGLSCPYPQHAPFPEHALQMIDEITLYVADGGPNRLGFIRGTKVVNPNEWFFKAHFYQDPVCPGSLGLESYQQLLKYVAVSRWKTTNNTHFEPITLNHEHHWIYRGQIIPSNSQVTVEAVITEIDDQSKTIKADGYLSVDGKLIYQIKDFGLRITS
ncbi:MAG: beta-ketoacyl synthase N-terminal-like domain-containing protein [Thermodesulfobacteriota bacterium]|nr:beta-ketoacyl synthase N-terminal-like domain-containing protein [Thermodesulfobacteriota bacterium]